MSGSGVSKNATVSDVTAPCRRSSDDWCSSRRHSRGWVTLIACCALLTEHGASSHLQVGGLEEFSDLVPVDRMGMVELQREPAAVAMVR